MVETTDLERRSRARESRVSRHAQGAEQPRFDRAFAAMANLAYDGALVSASAVDLNTGESLISVDDAVALPTASIGKILLLIEVSARLTEGQRSVFGIVDRTAEDFVADSGIWQHLQAGSLPLSDLAALVGSSSDNLATNVLLRRVGLDSVRARAESLGLRRTALLDRVRDSRGPDDAPQLSVGSTAELSRLMASLALGQVVDADTSQRVLGWLSMNSDLSLVAAAFGLDPLAHRERDHGVLLVNKTGTDKGVRSEVGALAGNKRGLAYAVTVTFEDGSLPARLRVLDAMRTVGYDLLEYVH